MARDLNQFNIIFEWVNNYKFISFRFLVKFGHLSTRLRIFLFSFNPNASESLVSIVFHLTNSKIICRTMTVYALTIYFCDT